MSNCTFSPSPTLRSSCADCSGCRRLVDEDVLADVLEINESVALLDAEPLVGFGNCFH